MSTRLRVLAGVLALMFVQIAAAHHSPAMIYDLTREIEVHGVVTEYRLGNPHLRIYLDVTQDGVAQKWMAEGGSRTVLLRTGWDGSEVRAGDEVTVRGHPTRDGSNVVHLQYLILADGTSLFGEDINEDRLESVRRRRQ